MLNIFVLPNSPTLRVMFDKRILFQHGNLEIWDFRFIHVTDIGLVGLVEHGFSGDETKLEMLKTNISLERRYIRILNINLEEC